MSRSILIELAFDSIKEILQTKELIDKDTLLHTYPLLKEQVPIELNIYVANKLHGSYKAHAKKTLLEDIILGSKIAAFEANKPLKIREFLQTEIEIILQTPGGVISHRA